MTTRREFINQLGLITSGALLAQSDLLASNVVKMPTQIGIQLYTLRDNLDKDVKGTIQQLGKIGFNHVETYFGYKGGGTDSFWGLKPKELKTLLDANKLKTHSGHYQLNDFLTPGNGNADALQYQLDIAAELGQSYLIVPIPPFGLWDKMDTSIYKFMAEQLNKAGEVAKKSGIKLGYHNHFWEFKKLSDGNVGYEILLNETDPNLVCFELDLFWATKAGQDPVSIFHKYPKRIVMWHVKDIDKSKAGSVYATPEGQNAGVMDILKDVKFAEVGSGAMDFKTIFKHNNDVKYIFVEQDQIYMPNKLDSVAQSYNYIKKSLLK